MPRRKILTPVADSEQATSAVDKYSVPFYTNTLPMVSWDFETLFVIDVNDAALSTYGYTRAEFLQLNIRDIRPKEDVEILEKATSSEESYGTIHRRIWRHQKKNGNIIFADVSGYLVNIDGRKVVINHIFDITEKVKAEEQLKKSEERYRLLFQKTPVPMVIYDLNTCQIVEINDIAIQFYGYSRKEFLAMTIFDYRPKDEVDYIKTRVSELENSDKVQHFGIFTHIKKDGTFIKVDISGYTITYDGRDCMLAACNDVTEKENALQTIKEREQKLYESEQQLLLIYDNIKDVVFLLDVEAADKYIFSSVNQAFENITGLKAAAVIGKYVHEVIPEPSLSLVLANYGAAIKMGTKMTWEESTTYPTGNKTGMVTITPIFNNAGICTQLVGSVYDVTDLRREERMLKLMESVITNTKDAIVITDAQNVDNRGPKILFVNTAFTEMTGYTAAEVMGKTPQMLQGAGTDRVELDRLKNAINNFEPCEITIINYKKSGAEYWVNFTSTPIRDASGNFTHWVAIQRDVTAEKYAETLLENLYSEKNAILESIGDGFFAIDENWTVTYWNKMAETLMHKKKEDIVGKDLRDVYPIKPGRVSYTYYEKVFKDKKQQSFEIFTPEVDRWFEVSIYPSSTGLSIYFKDVTQRFYHNKTIEDQNTKLREIAWMQSHETRAPVANILGLIALLKNKELTEEEQSCILNYLDEAALSLDKVIKTIIQQTDHFTSQVQ